MSEEFDAYRLLVKARALMSEGLNRQAALELERAVTLEPQKDSITETYARALFNSGQLRKALVEFTKVAERCPTNHYAHFGVALCKERLGDRRGAIAMLKIAVAMRPDMTDYRDALERLAG